MQKNVYGDAGRGCDGGGGLLGECGILSWGGVESGNIWNVLHTNRAIGAGSESQPDWCGSLIFLNVESKNEGMRCWRAWLLLFCFPKQGNRFLSQLCAGLAQTLQRFLYTGRLPGRRLAICWVAWESRTRRHCRRSRDMAF